MAHECVVRLRGLPWSCTNTEVSEFLNGVNIMGGDRAIVFVKNYEGKMTGEGFVAVETEGDVNKALTYSNQHIGKRYIEVYAGKKNDMNSALARAGFDVGFNNGNENSFNGPTSSTIVKMRGLPFGCSKEEIANFFGGLMIARNGITILKDAQGRASGDAFVEFTTSDMVPRALEKNKESIGHRYIELFECDSETRNMAINRNHRQVEQDDRPRGRPGPYERQRFNDRPFDDRRGRFDEYERGYNNRYDYDREQMRGGYGDGYDRGYPQRREEYPRRMEYENDRYDNERYNGGSAQYNNGGGQYSNGGGQYNNAIERKPRGKPAPKRLYKYNTTTGFNVHMRGLPYQATDQDICDFFKPLRPMNIVRHINEEGRSAGEADVDFYTDGEALQAMQRDKESIQHRYIELFYFNTTSTPAAETYAENKTYVQQY